MAEQVPFGIAQQLISALGSTALDEINLAKGAQKELKKLRETLTSIQAVLQDADELQQQKNKLVQQWIRRLRDVLYEADDLLDEVATESLRQKVDARGRTKREVRDFFSSSNQLVSRVKMGHRIKNIREKLDQIARDMSQFNFLPRKVEADWGLINNIRETDSAVPKDEIIGREGNERDIIKLLKQPADHNSENVSVVAIVGMGGLGKTTLAQKVYNAEWVKRYFTKRMWVCVSEDFNVKTLAKKILKCLINGEVGDLELEQLQSRIRENLERKTYLLILDDVWNENEERWDHLKKILFYGAQGSKIVVTTRSRKVAYVMGIDVESHSLYELKGLSDEESCILFEKKALKGREDKPVLLEIGKELVRERCKGVPLAIKTLASAVRSYPDEAYWLSIKENDQMWSVANREDVEDSIFLVLKMSYYHLPNHLKQCFACCSFCPKDEPIPKQLLIRYWLAQGCIQSSNGGKDLEEIGDMYFDELLSRSFFQEPIQDLLGNIEIVTMHDLIHDLAQLFSESDCLNFPFSKEKKVPERVHHIRFDDELNNFRPNEITNTLESISMLKTGLRTFGFRGVKEEEIKCNIGDFVISNFKCLRVLALSNPFAELPSSIGKLRHLRYLLLRYFGFKKLPDTICNLLNLQTLEVHNCYSLEELPKELSKLVSLRHLVIECCPKLRSMPMGLGKLAWLRQLSTIFITRENRYELNELSDLNLLRGELCLEGLENVRDVESEAKQVNLKGKKCLQCLRFTWSHYAYPLGNSTVIEKDESLLDTLEPHPNLKAMLVRGYGGKRLSGWLSCITNLVHLEIVNCVNCMHLPPLDQLKSLKHLQLIHMPSLEYMEFSCEASTSSSSMATTTCFFPYLKELHIHRCYNFRGWRREADVDVELQPCVWFPRLSGLTIVGCPKLSSMPLFPTLEEELILWSTGVELLQQTMELEITNTPAPSFSSSSLIFLQVSSSPLSNLKRLTLSNLEGQQPSTLWELGLRRLTALEFLWINDCPRLASLPDCLHHLSSLQRLKIYGCKELAERCRKGKGPDWWKIQHVPNISTYFEEIGEW